MNGSKINVSGNKNNNYQDELFNYDHYIAIDWSIENMAIARMTKKTAEAKLIDVDADIKELKIYLRKITGRKILTIEETTSSQWLYVELKEYVERIVVCDPYRNRLLSDGPKTDKIDARKLCELLRSGMLKEVYHTTDELYKLRKLVSGYEALVRAGVRCINQKSAIYRAEHKSHKKGEIISDKTTEFIVLQLDKSIEQYIIDKKEYEEEFEKRCKKQKILEALKSVPGIAEINAMKIFATVIDGRRFKAAGNYLGYCGLVKHIKISGRREYGKRRTRYSRRLKSVYKTAALAAIRGNNPIREYYEYLINEKKISEENAKQSVARCIAKITYGIMKSGEKYKPYLWRGNKKSTQSGIPLAGEKEAA